MVGYSDGWIVRNYFTKEGLSKRGRVSYDILHVSSYEIEEVGSPGSLAVTGT